MKELITLKRFFVKYKTRLLLGTLFVAAANLFGIIPAQLIRKAVDSVAAFQSSNNIASGNLMLENAGKQLLYLTGLIIFFTLLKGVLMFFMRQTLIVMSRWIEFDQKNEIYDHYQKLGNRFYHSESTGDMVNRISEDVSRVRMFTGPALMYSVNLTVMFIMVIIAMMQVNAKLALYVAVPLPLMSFLIYFIHEIIHRKSENVQIKLSGMASQTQEYFSGIRILKSFSGETQAMKMMDTTAEEYKNLSSELNRVNALFMPLLFLLIGLSTILTVYMGGLEVMAGRATVGNLAEFVVYVNMLTWPVASLGWVVTLVQRAAASQKRINEFLSFAPDIISGKVNIKSFTGQIQFNHVSYQYPGTEVQALLDISFNVQSGQTLGITGRTGSGKSTLAMLLLRQDDINSGEILVDGINLRELNLTEFRNLAGYVPQDAFLFSDTILANIKFGAVNADLHSVTEAARWAEVHNEIEQFTDGYETVIGERGITLSGGQKQRIAMARAFIRKPKLLILDDCLSAVDAKTEKAILSNIKILSTGVTTVIISHKLSAIQHADEIIVLDHGRIAERGKHHELIHAGGIYSGIHQLQQMDVLA